MMTVKTRFLLELGRDRLHEDLKDVMKSHASDGGMPCDNGLREFTELVRFHRTLIRILDPYKVRKDSYPDATYVNNSCMEEAVPQCTPMPSNEFGN
jgi:hypothetical protein